MGERRTRGRPSRVDQLAPEVRQTLDRLLRDGRHTQQEILDHINRLAEAPLSRSGLNRYATRMETVGAKLRETREVANAWMARFGDEPASDVLQLVVEMMQGALFKYALKASETDDDELFDPALMKDVTLSIQRLARSAEMNTKREKEIRKAFAEQAVEQAEAAAHEQGLSAEAVQRIKDKILGIAA
ncbi:MAG: DUF3486 family protein [Pseudomonadota bacterium]